MFVEVSDVKAALSLTHIKFESFNIQILGLFNGK